MKKVEDNYKSWSLYDIEKNIKNNKIIDYLKYIKEKYNDNKVLEILKVSGFFISYNESFCISEKQMEKIDSYIQAVLGEKYLVKYKDLKKEAEYLHLKQQIISREIDEMIREYGLNEINLIKSTVSYMSYIRNNSQEYSNLHIKISSLEYCVFALGMLLKARLWKNEDNEKEGEIISMQSVSLLFYKVCALRELNEVIQSWMYGNTDLVVDDEIQIQELYGRNYDRILSSLTYWDIKDIKTMKNELTDKNENEKYREELKEKIVEYFYTKDFKEEFRGLSLEKWIIGYTILAKISRNNENLYIVQSKYEWISYLCDEELKEEEAKVFLNVLSFDKTSKDLFDCPFIQYKDNLILIPEIFLFIDGSRTMMSLFGYNCVNDSLYKKGENFELYIMEMIKENNINVIPNIKVNHENETYEIDLAMVLDKNLFVIECKTQYQHEDMRGYYRNIMELDYYIDKFKRNFEFFTKNEVGIEKLFEKLGEKNFNNQNAIFVGNIVYPDRKKEHIYISDETRIYRYMKRKAAMVYEFIPQEKVVKETTLFTQFYSGTIQAQQFINYLNNKDNELEIDGRRIKLSQIPILNNWGIKLERFLPDSSKNYLNL